MSLGLEEELRRRLERAALHPGLRETLLYAVLPAGKLFRPRLTEAMARDLGAPQGDALHLGLALELHHAYSLVHDDLPCMDDDDVRRGRPATHKAFGEWKALLAGDALLALSYAELERLTHPRAAQVRRLFHWATGPKGLVLGQWIDLGLEAKGATGAVRMHELKTGRLMQIACAGVGLLSPTDVAVKQGLRLGAAIGVAFQLLDDLDDLAGEGPSPHETAVNPFLVAPTETAAALTHARGVLQQRLANLPTTRAFLEGFLAASMEGLRRKRATLEKRLPASLLKQVLA